MDDITAMRVGMISAMEDLTWREEATMVPGERCFRSPNDSVQLTIARDGTQWAFGYDRGNTDEIVITYRTFAEGATWREFERALLLARLVSEENEFRQLDLAGQWWNVTKPHERWEWFSARKLHQVGEDGAAWSCLHWSEQQRAVQEILKGVTK